MAHIRQESLLRKSLFGNALFSAVSGVGLALFSGSLASLIGGVAATPLLLVGLVLLFYAADLARTAFGASLPRGRIYYFIVMDVIWVLGSIVAGAVRAP